MKFVFIVLISVLSLCRNGQAQDFENPCLSDTNKLFNPHPFDQTKFIQCTLEGKMMIMGCPLGLQWNDEKISCDNSQSNSGIEDSGIKRIKFAKSGPIGPSSSSSIDMMSDSSFSWSNLPSKKLNTVAKEQPIAQQGSWSNLPQKKSKLLPALLNEDGLTFSGSNLPAAPQPELPTQSWSNLPSKRTQPIPQQFPTAPVSQQEFPQEQSESWSNLPQRKSMKKLLPELPAEDPSTFSWSNLPSKRIQPVPQQFPTVPISQQEFSQEQSGSWSNLPQRKSITKMLPELPQEQTGSWSNLPSKKTQQLPILPEPQPQEQSESWSNLPQRKSMKKLLPELPAEDPSTFSWSNLPSKRIQPVPQQFPTVPISQQEFSQEQSGSWSNLPSKKTQQLPILPAPQPQEQSGSWSNLNLPQKKIQPVVSQSWSSPQPQPVEFDEVPSASGSWASQNQQKTKFLPSSSSLSSGRQLDLGSINLPTSFGGVSLEDVSNLADALKSKLTEFQNDPLVLSGQIKLSDIISLQDLNNILQQVTGANVDLQNIQLPQLPQSASSGRINSMPSQQDCSSFEISGSILDLVNGEYSQLNLGSPQKPIYKRNSNPTRPGLIVPLPKGWCFTASFSLFSDDSLTAEIIDQNCRNLDCCLLVSDIFDSRPVFDSRRVWAINALQQKGQRDQSIRFRCIDNNFDQQQPQLPVIQLPISGGRSTFQTVNRGGRSDSTSIQPTADASSSLSILVITDCSRVTCSNGLQCIPVKGGNPRCGQFGVTDDRFSRSLTCENVKCPNSGKCALDNRDKLIKCVVGL